MPNRRPERTTEIAEARLFSGARSAARGMRIWGVTVRTPTRNERASKTARLLVTARPIVKHVDNATMQRIRDRRRSKSPRGEISTKPVAYLDGEINQSSRYLPIYEEKLTRLEQVWGFCMKMGCGVQADKEVEPNTRYIPRDFTVGNIESD